MYKELIISTIIVIIIFSLDYMTQKYTDYSVTEITSGLESMKSDIREEKVDSDEADKKINDLYADWNKYHNVLVYYIEHNELEKVETSLIACKSFIEAKEYNEAIAELDKTVFILDHINDKYLLNLENIF